VVTANDYSYLIGPMVKVVVGEDIEVSTQTFFVHADLLTSRSSFFAKALRSYAKAGRSDDEDKAKQVAEHESIQWREGEEGMVKLPVDEPEIFANYTKLIYAGVLPILNDPKKPEMDPTKMTEDETKKAEADFRERVICAVELVFESLGKLYAFCEKIRDKVAKQTLLESFVKECSETRASGSNYYPGPVAVRDIYSGTLPSDPLRTFLADSYAHVGHSKWVGQKQNYESFSHEFLFDLAAELYKVRAAPVDSSRIRDTKYYLDKLTEFEKEEMEPEDMEVE
jgi:hypothetical protein